MAFARSAGCRFVSVDKQRKSWHGIITTNDNNK